MSVTKGPFIINLKNYLEISGDKALAFTKEAERVSQKLGTRIVISPPQPLIAWVARNTSLEIVSQHVDFSPVGPSTGFTIPEMIKESGVVGSLINHSEHPIDINCIKEILKKMRSLELVSVVCTKNFNELTDISKLEPDYIAIEPPELIGTKRSISTEKPSLIKESSDYLLSNGVRSKLICGAGINTPEDIRIALDLGSEGILVASSIVKSDNWYEKIYELAKQFKESK
ncbi:triose-phosphate isomerase [Candidatus Nitrosocosmicus franklandus]|uniref:Triosephosphate isomerase n=1 Tax=Candidatus Nitrosocosmicus franklandianus TaxID=1798806 RepID=A0A484IGZ6_9ARCH|nr:triose-phosphate isomerase [Candidatus Nitrosocosmicus franklandus]VFJ15302.1 Triosephosphate isomerase [Candidatus Nitrosocosmicus franklandus]